MTKTEIKQLARQEFGSLAHLGRKLDPPVTGQTISLVIDGKRTSSRLVSQIAKQLGIKRKALQQAV